LPKAKRRRMSVRLGEAEVVRVARKPTEVYVGAVAHALLHIASSVVVEGLGRRQGKALAVAKAAAALPGIRIVTVESFDLDDGTPGVRVVLERGEGGKCCG
jgi:DNA-binding protein